MADTVDSIQLSMILDLIIGTEDYIKVKRMYALICRNLIKVDDFNVYVIGSQCDGLGLLGSDIDCMLVRQQIPVIDTLCGDEPDITTPSNYLLACFSPSPSAYMCLEMHIQLNNVLNFKLHVIEDLFHNAIYFRDSLLASSFFISTT